MKAFIAVDLQNDFMPGGALEIETGDEVVPIVNRLVRHFTLSVAARDWHPENHVSFTVNHENRQPGDVITVNGLEQILWPPHCVQGTYGAEFHDDLDVTAFQKIIKKGTNPDFDSYSAFYDNGRKNSTGLTDYLRNQGATDVYIAGLATDYCVKYSVLDAAKDGFRTFVFIDASRGVDLQEGDVEKAKEEMKNAGATFLNSDEFTE